MINIKFKMCFTGLTDEDFFDTLVVYKPFLIETRSYAVEEEISQITQLDKYLKQDKSIYRILERQTGRRAIDIISHDSLYVEHEKYMYGFSKPLTILEIAKIFKTKNLNVFSFIAIGGVSIHAGGYLLKVPSDESVHNLKRPHVHVYKGKGGHMEGGTRYTLDDEITCIDLESRPASFRRDEKKKIVPAIKTNKETLLEHWNMAKHNGIVPPIINESGKQFLVDR